MRTEDNGKPTVHWVWELPSNDALLKPFRERAMREHVHDFLDGIEEVTERNTFDALPESGSSPKESNDHSWEEFEESDSSPEPVLESPEGRRWDD